MVGLLSTDGVGRTSVIPEEINEQEETGVWYLVPSLSKQKVDRETRKSSYREGGTL